MTGTDVAALAGKDLRDFKADSACAANDDGLLALQSKVQGFSPQFNPLVAQRLECEAWPRKDKHACMFVYFVGSADANMHRAA